MSLDLDIPGLVKPISNIELSKCLIESILENISWVDN
jgi:hypothetical protein